MVREAFVQLIAKKKIILFGAGNYAQKFYNDFKDVLIISFCISNDPMQTAFIVDEKEVCPISRVVDYEKNENEYLILCAADTSKMKKQMSDMGYLYGKDYIDSEFFRILRSHKSIVLCYGVCYIRAIRNCLEQSAGFKAKYASWFFLDYLQRDVIDELFLHTLLQNCDVFIYNVFLSKEGARQNKIFKKLINKNCITIRVPVFTFQGFYPKYLGNSIYKRSYSVSPLQGGYSPFTNVDPNINELICQRKSVREIKHIISNIDFYEKEDLKLNLKKECKKLELTEKETDINIYPFIEKNIRKKRLFLNESHLSNEVIIEMARQILKHLELPDDLERKKLLNEVLLYTSEVPIYPSVIHHLDLTLYQDKPKYKLFTFKGYQEVTFDEYIERYVEFCSTMKAYMEQGVFPE